MAALAGSLWHPQTAYASGEDYVFYNDNPKTIYARQGVFKDSGLVTFTSTASQDPNIPSGLQSTYNDIVKAPNSNFNDGTYVATYTCKTATIYALIGLTKGIGVSDTGALYVLGSTGGALSGSGTHTASWVKNNGCAPASANTNGYVGNPTPLSVPLYSGLSASDGQNWYNFLKSHGKNVKDPGTAKLTDGPGAGAAGGDDTTGDTSPTCESSGGPFAWALCPIFNGLSDASQWILQNIVEPFLITPPISTDPSDPSFQIWSNLRVYGDIFLIIALLVIVFGESIGGGLIDAYTAKKVLPRLLVAAVLINLSIYLVALMVDITNVIGRGIGDILTAPLTNCTAGGGNCWDFNLSLADQGRVFGVGLIGLLVGGTAVTGFLGSIIFGGFAAVSSAITVAFFVLLPLFFSVLAVFITLILRKGLILLLILVSPVAFALYCLPNTERFFKRWWDLLFEALMVYPIVIAIFGVAEILSVTILNANSIVPSSFEDSNSLATTFDGNINRTLALVVAFLLQFLPLLAIPFAFRFASGALGRIYEAATGAGAKANQLAENRREHAKRDYQAGALTARARMYHRANEFGENHQGPLGIGRRAGRFAARRAGGYNIEALMSAGRAEYAKEVNDQIATGRDEEIRGLTVNKQWALQHGQEGVDWRERDDGTREFRSLGGAWISEQNVDAGHSRWGNNQFAQQAALSYEMRKAITEEDVGRIADHYNDVAAAPGGWGMSRGEAAGAFKGAAFENQNQHVEFKHLDTENGTMDDHALVDEIYNNRGSYNLSQMNSHTIESLKNAHERAVTAGDIDQQEKIAGIAETFMHSSGIAGMDEDGNPIPPARTATETATGRRQANVQGSAHTAERVVELARMTGVYDHPPRGQYTDPDHAPTPNERQQS